MMLLSYKLYYFYFSFNKEKRGECTLCEERWEGTNVNGLIGESFDDQRNGYLRGSKHVWLSASGITVEYIFKNSIQWMRRPKGHSVFAIVSPQKSL